MKKVLSFISPGFTRLLFICSVLISSLYSTTVEASHMEGADLRFRCLGGNQYEITLSFYRDCAGIDSDLSAFINITSASCGQTLSLTANRTSVVEASPLCASQITQSTCNGGTLPGVQLCTYVGVITLPMACNDWIVSYSSCCRNSSITNISAPGSANMYIEGRINNLNVTCNNSPDFTTPPVPYICSGVPFSYNHGVVDPEGDSLRYTMITPLNAAGTPLTYNAGYTVGSPLTMTGGLTFDPNTGQMTFTPNGTQIVAIAVRVDEYRNGVLIGSVIRDMQIVVISCTNNPPVASPMAGLVGGTLSGNTISTCPGNVLSFNITANDVDAGQILSIVHTIGTNLPGATVVITGTRPINIAVTWTVPAVPLPSYNFSITFRDNACPIIGQQTIGYLIDTGPQLTITPSSPTICPGQNVTLTASGGVGTYVWSTGATAASITVAPMVNTTYTVNGTAFGGCPAQGTFTVTMSPPLPLAIAASPSTSICAGQSVTLTAAAATNYSWNTGATTASITVSPASTTVYSVNANIGTCSAAGSITITTGSISGTGVTVCQGGSGSLSSSSSCPIVAGSSIAQGATFNSGTLTTTDPTWSRSGTTCTPSGITAYYDVFTFTVSTAGSYTFTGCFPAIDAYGNLFQTSFDPLNPCAAGTFVTGNDDSAPACGADPMMTATLSPGVTYYLISTTFSSLTTDSYSWTYTGPAGATITSGTPGTIQWYTAASGGAPIGTGSPFNPVGVAGSGLPNTNTVGTTTYYVACSGAPACRAAVNFTVVSSSAPTISGTSTICAGQSTTLTASAGTAYLWSTGATSASITVNPASTTTYTATVTSGCVATASRTVTVNPSPSISVSSSASAVCAGQSVTLTASGGTTYSWSTGGATASISVTPATTTVYSVTGTTSGCSGVASTTVTINNISATGVTICQGGSGSLTSSAVCPATGTTIAQGATFNSGTLTTTDPTWSRSGTTCTPSGVTAYYDVFTFTVSTAGSYTFTGCFPAIDAYGNLFQTSFDPLNPCAAGTFITGNDDGASACSLDPLITATLTPGVTYYLISTTYGSLTTDSYSWTYTGPAGATITTGGGPAGVIQWYTAASGGTAIGTGSPFNPVGVAGSGLANTNTAGTTTYYAACSSNPTCRTAVNFVISAASTAITSVPVSSPLCPNTNVTLTASGGSAGTGTTITWYTGANGTGSLLGTGASITLAPTASTTVYVRREGGCSGNTPDFTVNLNVMPYVYAANGTTSNTYCTDNSGWKHFYTGGNIIFSISGNISGAPAGFPVVTIWDNNAYYQQTQGPFTAASCAGGLTPGEERFEMERSWNVNMGGGAVVAPYDIRFYYQPAERTAIETAAANWMSTYPACGYTYKYPTPLGFYWFKNTGSTYSAPDYDGTHYGASIGTTSNGINYAQWTGIPSFSGGSGAVILVPNTLLNVKWLYFSGETDNKINYLRWATETEQNTVHFNIQRSQDGINFTTIGTVAAQGNSTTTTHYAFDDENPFKGENYYRLELVETNGNASYSNTIRLLITDNGLGYNFYPNPTNDVVYYQYETIEKEDLKIEVLDVLGKQVANFNVTSNVGINNISVDLSDFPTGAYMVRVHHLHNSNVHTAKVIKNKP